MATAVWIQARIDAAQTAIVAIETALTALVGGAQSYTLDTGQTRQVVTKVDLSSLKNLLKYQESRLAELEEALASENGTSTGTSHMVPIF